MSELQDVSGLMDQIHELKTQLADAEKRGAIKALRALADRLQREGLLTLPSAPFVLRREAQDIDCGQVSL